VRVRLSKGKERRTVLLRLLDKDRALEDEDYDIKPKPCIGSGYCCWKAPCHEAQRAHDGALTSGPCPELRWNGERHLCGLILDADAETAERLKRSLSVGAGCCSGLNSWRREPLKDRTDEK